MRYDIHHNENCNSSKTPVITYFLDPEMQLLKEVPLYNDVMLPSTREKLPMPLSPLAPSDLSSALEKIEPGREDCSFSSTSHSTSDIASTPSSSISSSEVDTFHLLIISDAIMNGKKEFCCCDGKIIFLLSSPQPRSPADYYHVDSDIGSEFKLDLVEKMFATDPEANNPFSMHVRQRYFVVAGVHAIFYSIFSKLPAQSKMPYFLHLRKWVTLTLRCSHHIFQWMMTSSCISPYPWIHSLLVLRVLLKLTPSSSNHLLGQLQHPAPTSL